MPQGLLTIINTYVLSCYTERKVDCNKRQGINCINKNMRTGKKKYEIDDDIELMNNYDYDAVVYI